MAKKKHVHRELVIFPAGAEGPSGEIQKEDEFARSLARELYTESGSQLGEMLVLLCRELLRSERGRLELREMCESIAGVALQLRAEAAAR